MIGVLYDRKAADAPERAREDREFRTRIRAEFHEMPGLRLTLPQASRLFNLEPTDCARVLCVWPNGYQNIGADVALGDGKARDSAATARDVPQRCEIFPRCEGWQ